MIVTKNIINTLYGLAPKVYPNLNEIWKKADASKLNNDTKREKRSGGRERSMYFYIGFFKIWGEKITTSL